MSITRQRILFVVIAICMSFSCGVFADDRTADEVLAELDSIKMPTYERSKRSDRKFMAKIRVEIRALNLKKSKLAGELFRVDPDHERLGKLMPLRWTYLKFDLEQSATITDEMQEIFTSAPDTELAKRARFEYASKKLYDNSKGREKSMEDVSKAVESFISHHPEDSRNFNLLKNLAIAYGFGSNEQLALYNRIKKSYPDKSKYIDTKIKQIKSIGKPFELEFQDAITGTTISMKDLKGQVVVLDFWATWCRPCVAEMPHMKKLYAKYHDEGVQFIGISLDKSEDQGGLAALKKYVSEKEIPWPQYYQGNKWASEFSTSWGIGSIPAMFVIDKKGNLKSTQARYKLEKLIPQLLAE
ncbi:MAG: TlpA family protein disulfide reductase [Planctomycetes bacterium]|nr:TlpA family protein disulfide reductase [Planctomycetota bacterium]